MLHFPAIFSYPEKNRFGRDFAFVPFDHHFRQITCVIVLNVNFLIKFTDLHIKALPIRYLSSVYVQWFGRELRSKPFLRLSFIYIEISPARENFKQKCIIIKLFPFD